MKKPLAPADRRRPAAGPKAPAHVPAPGLKRVELELPDGRYLLSYSRSTLRSESDA